jgi:serine/threonine protein phosphatase PrpC
MMDFACHTDRGLVRSNNEDAFGTAPELNLFVLSDGMGGLEAGEVASRLAVETILAHCHDAAANPSLRLIGAVIPGVSDTSNRLASAVRLANRAIYDEAMRKQPSRGMGATVVAVQIIGGRMSVAHVGDSRVYRLRDHRFEQLTQDHSFVGEQVRQGNMTQEQADATNLTNVLLRALGVDREVEVDVSEELIMGDDTVLLCSDGLTCELSDAKIAEVLAVAEDSQEAADELVELAKRAGGGDNITALVLRPALRPAGAMARILEKWFKGHRSRRMGGQQHANTGAEV